MSSAVAVKSLSAYFVIRSSAAAITLSGSLIAVIIALYASSSDFDLAFICFATGICPGASGVAGGGACAIRHVAPAPIATRPVSIVRFMRQTPSVSLLLLLGQFQALLRFLARLVGRAFQLKCALEILRCLAALAGCHRQPSQIHQVPCLVERLRFRFQGLLEKPFRRVQILLQQSDPRQPVIRRGVHAALLGTLQRLRSEEHTSE